MGHLRNVGIEIFYLLELASVVHQVHGRLKPCLLWVTRNEMLVD